MPKDYNKKRISADQEHKVKLILENFLSLNIIWISYNVQIQEIVKTQYQYHHYPSLEKRVRKSHEVQFKSEEENKYAKFKIINQTFLRLRHHYYTSSCADEHEKAYLN